MDSIHPIFHLKLDVIGADLSALGISEEQVKTSFSINADYEGNFDQFDFKSTIEDGLVVHEQNPYPLGNFSLSAGSKQNNTEYKITSEFLNLKLDANTSQEKISPPPL